MQVPRTRKVPPQQENHSTAANKHRHGRQDGINQSRSSSVPPVQFWLFLALYDVTNKNKSSPESLKWHQSETKWDGAFVWLNVDMNKYSSFLKKYVVNFIFRWGNSGLWPQNFYILSLYEYFFFITSLHGKPLRSLFVSISCLFMLHPCLCCLIPTRRLWTTVFAFWYGERPVLPLVYFLVCISTFTWWLFFIYVKKIKKVECL